MADPRLPRSVAIGRDFVTPGAGKRSALGSHTISTADYHEANTRIGPKGERCCRACHAAYERQRRRELKQAA